MIWLFISVIYYLVSDTAAYFFWKLTIDTIYAKSSYTLIRLLLFEPVRDFL